MFDVYQRRAFASQLSPVKVGSSGDYCVRFDSKWLPYIRGLLLVLASRGTWEGNDARSADEATALVQAFFEKSICGTLQPECNGECFDMGCGCLRWNNGVLEMYSCGKWVPVPGVSGGGVTPTQPGSGSGQPRPGGGTKTYCLGLTNGAHAILPTVVNSGDILLMENLQGAWDEIGNPIWHCPDGWTFVLDTCTNPILVPNEPTDPIQGVQPMSIIAKIGSTYYDIIHPDFNGNPQPFTVPAGHVNDTVEFQANTDGSHPIQGQVTFCCSVTNNGQQFETLTLPITSADPVVSNMILLPGLRYNLIISGTGHQVNANPNLYVDAFYTTSDNWATHERNDTDCGAGNFLEIMIDGERLANIPEYSASHSYLIPLTGDGRQLSLSYYDCVYTDDEGALNAVLSLNI